MSYSYDRTAGTRVAYFNIDTVKLAIKVDLAPEKVEWAPDGHVLMTGKAKFILPNKEHEGQPYELVVSEDGKVRSCKCSDPIQRQLIWLAAEERPRDLRELVEDQKERGPLRKKP